MRGVVPCFLPSFSFLPSFFLCLILYFGQVHAGLQHNRRFAKSMSESDVSAQVGRILFVSGEGLFVSGERLLSCLVQVG